MSFFSPPRVRVRFGDCLKRSNFSTKRWSVFPFVWVGIGVLMVATCAPATDSSPGFMSFDSGGVLITESSRPQWNEADGWRLGEEPRIEIGSLEGEDPYLFYEVRGVTIAGDGTIIVANRSDNTLRFFNALGQYQQQVGGTGGGPEEFSSIHSLQRIGQNLFACQYDTNPVRVFDINGAFLRSVFLPRIPGFRGVHVQGVFSDGSILLSDFPQGYPKQVGAYVQFSTLVRVPSVGEVDSIARLPAIRYVNIDGHLPYQAFGPRLKTAVGEMNLYFSFTEKYEISVLNIQGQLTKKIRLDRPLSPVTNEDVREYRRRSIEEGGERMRHLTTLYADNMVFPEHHPAHGRLLVDRTGHLWVERASHEPGGMGPTAIASIPRGFAEWDVFDSEGIWLGAVEIPSGLYVHEIGSDYVAGVWKDEFDVERVRVYDLLKR